METPLKWLEGHGAQVKRQSVALSAIDKEASLKNQARVSAPLHEDAVLLYGVAMEAGQEFPPIIVYKNSNDMYVVVDGNHRVAGAEVAGVTALTALVIQNPTPNMIQALTYEANTKHGIPTTIDERVQQALHLEISGMPRGEAAKALGIPESRLAGAAELQRVDMRIFHIKRAALGELSIQARRRLGNIRNDNVLAAALELVTSSRMSAIEVNDLVSKINRQSTEADQMLEVQREVGRQATKVAATAGGKVALPQAIVELNRALAAVDRLDPEAIAKAWPVMGEAMKMVFMAKVMDCHKRIKEVMNG